MQFINFLWAGNFIQEFVCVAFLGSQQHAVSGKDPQTRPSVAYSFHGILHLVETAWNITRIGLTPLGQKSLHSVYMFKCCKPHMNK